LRLMGVAAGDRGMELCTVAAGGHQGMQARLEWERV
jgi:hypothetical protein